MISKFEVRCDKFGNVGIGEVLCKRTKKAFTIEEIKKAFWDTFHKRGELFFSDYDDDCEIATLSFWKYFLENLEPVVADLVQITNK